jgi:pimeloyl-ACP methyl ester carboxylesterase
MDPTMDTRVDAVSNPGSTAVSRRQAVHGLGALTLAALSLGGRLPSAAAQEATPAATPGADWAATFATPGQRATINGAAIYYEVRGPADGPPVLLMPGDLNNTDDFVNLVPVLAAAGYRTVAMDLRGRGRSTWGDKPITYTQMAADALGLLDYLGIAQTDVVGWSQGAVIALELALHHPERLDRVVVYGAIFSPACCQFVESDELPPFERFIANYQRLSPEPERWDELLEVLGALDEVAPNYSAAELGSIAVPVLVLDGEEEEFIKPEHTTKLAELIPGSTLVLMPGTGHFALLSHPGLFDQIVLDYLAGKTPATPTAGTPTS